MKKILFLGMIFSAMISTSVYAQPAQPAAAEQGKQTVADPAAVLQEMKNKVKPQMMDKTGLTEAQVDRVVEINFEIRQLAGTALKGLSDEERSKKLAELKAEKESRYAAIPLTAEQIKSVYAFYEDMGKNQQERRSH